jgi:hypothetical protein
MNPSLREAIKQHLVVGAVVLFALACALWPPADPLAGAAPDAPLSVPAPAAGEEPHSDFISSGGLVPDAAPLRQDDIGRTASNPVGAANAF